MRCKDKDVRGPACVRVRGANRGDRARARRLARELGLPLRQGDEESAYEAVLLVADGRLGLESPEKGSGKRSGNSCFPDWTRIDTASPAGRRGGQPLLRAVRGRKKYKGLLVWDATAGWGEDAWILAAMGHRVVAVERDPLVYLCLLDAWSRAAFEAPFATRRIRPVCGDSGEMLKRAADGPPGWHGPPLPDVVYLDPFFPEQSGKKAREGKSMRVLRVVAEKGEEGAEELLRPALRVARLRVVLKRPRKAKALSPEGRGPVHSVTGRGFRYDVYLPWRDVP